MNQSQIKMLEDNIKESKKIVNTADALKRLTNNHDFKEVVVNGYFREEAIRLVHLKADPAMDTPERQASILRQIDAISSFSTYLSEVERLGLLAEKNIIHDEETREELLQEDGE